VQYVEPKSDGEIGKLPTVASNVRSSFAQPRVPHKEYTDWLLRMAHRRHPGGSVGFDSHKRLQVGALSENPLRPKKLHPKRIWQVRSRCTMRSNNVSEPFGAILWRRVRLFTCRSDYGEDKVLIDRLPHGRVENVLQLDAKPSPAPDAFVASSLAWQTESSARLTSLWPDRPESTSNGQKSTCNLTSCGVVTTPAIVEWPTSSPLGRGSVPSCISLTRIPNESWGSPRSERSGGRQ
jgi:hypothetical protein